MARPRAADDFKAIRSRMEELRLERFEALAGQKPGSRVNRDISGDDNRKDERRFPRSALIRKLAR